VILTRSWHCLSSIFNAADHLRKGLIRVQLLGSITERRADVYTPLGFYEAKDGLLRTEDPAIEVPLADLFQALDD
jgi:hypothetical protein